MPARLYPVTQEYLSVVHPQAARSIFWEVGPAGVDFISRNGDPNFEKEAWLSTTILNYGCCGFSIGSLGDRVEDAPVTPRSVVATVLYCSREDAPGCAQLPTAPVSEDAEVITSLFIDQGRVGEGLEAVLLDAAIMELVRKDASAVEAFGWREEYIDDPDSPMEPAVREIVERAEEIGLMGVAVLESAGFQVVRDHPVLPRLRLELPPAQVVLSAEAVEQLLARSR